MALTLQTIAFLTSGAGCAALDWLAAQDLSDAQTLPLLETLRRDYTPDQAGAALTVARLRQRATAKFACADSMIFTPDALEQASGEIVSQHRAAQFAAAGYTRIADLGCGIGGDLLALARLPDAVIVGVDRDPVRLLCARANLAAYARDAALVCADLFDPLPLRAMAAIFFDPARRAGEQGKKRRIFSVRNYIPPLDIIHTWDADALAVKLSPGVQIAELDPYLQRGAGLEFVSVGGALKEAVLWGGALGFAGSAATRLDGDIGGAIMRQTLRPLAIPAPDLSAPRAYLYEPDPAVIRAGLLGELAAELGIDLFRLDEQIAYLTGDSYVTSSWMRVWPVVEWLPFNLKKLRAALRARDITQVTVKKRGSPLTPEGLIRQLKLRGEGESAVVVLTQIAGQHSAIICGEMLHPD